MVTASPIATKHYLMRILITEIITPTCTALCAAPMVLITSTSILVTVVMARSTTLAENIWAAQADSRVGIFASMPVQKIASENSRFGQMVYVAPQVWLWLQMGVCGIQKIRANM